MNQAVPDGTGGVDGKSSAIDQSVAQLGQEAAMEEGTASVLSRAHATARDQQSIVTQQRCCGLLLPVHDDFIKNRQC